MGGYVAEIFASTYLKISDGDDHHFIFWDKGETVDFLYSHGVGREFQRYDVDSIAVFISRFIDRPHISRTGKKNITLTLVLPKGMTAQRLYDMLHGFLAGRGIHHEFTKGQDAEG